MITIGIMGAPVNNPNHGCMALLYSLLTVLEEIEKETNNEFRYILFDWKYDELSIKRINNLLHIPSRKIEFSPYVMKNDVLRTMYHFFDQLTMKKNIRKCDVIIDCTEGDSFSDIYGDFLYQGRTKVKQEVEKMGIPLILGPQTYGPYHKKENEQLALNVLKNAALVLTRDISSQKYLSETFQIESVLTGDLAFALPFEQQKRESNGKLQIGINASSILYSQEEIKDRKFTLSLDYKTYIETLVKELSENENYEVHLIAHVNTDTQVHEILHKQFPNTILVPNFSNPIAAKSYISGLDLFIGARMHGTIAAFTSEVPVISTSYSPKFKGLYEGLGYDAIVDLCALSTEEALSKTYAYINSHSTLKEQVKVCQSLCLQRKEASKNALKEGIEKEARCGARKK